ncbi:MAG: C10 family peptidase [Candidatus Amulumruptor sp.]|nr:C10 family peptidase [Candidatus Amulumruptor sp.]
MRKFFDYVVALIAVMSVTGCIQTDDNVIVSEPISRSIIGYETINPDTASTIDAMRAMEIATMISKAEVAASRSASRVAESVEAITDTDDTPLMYVVNYASNQGFVILSASKSNMPILAQADEGRFDLAYLADDHPVNIWLDEQKFIARHIDDLPDSIQAKAATAWMAYNTDRSGVLALADVPEKPQVFYDSLRRWSLDPNIEVYRYEDYIQTEEYRFLSDEEKNTIINSIKALGNSNYGSAESSSLILRQNIGRRSEKRLLSTSWHQGSSYNDLSYNGKVPGLKSLGCVTIAVGQIMRYHKYPASFNWENMPDNYASSTTQDFLYMLGRQLGIDYSAEESASNIDKARKVLEMYGYTVKLHEYHHLSSVYDELKHNRPVYMRGIGKEPDGTKVGHAWVCDGYQYESSHTEIRVMTLDYRPTIYSTPDKMIEAYAMIKNYRGYERYHMNWGANVTPTINGFYSDSDISFKVDGELHNYNIDRKNLLIRLNQ